MWYSFSKLHLELYLFINNVLVFFHRLVVIDDSVASTPTTMFLIAFLIERSQLVMISILCFLCI
jgi:hypothetical protein